MTLWKSISDINNFIADFGDDAIVFNPVSGETHELNLLALDALTILSSPSTVDNLTETISQLYQIPSNSQLRLQLQRLIDDFFDLGLIEEANE